MPSSSPKRVDADDEAESRLLLTKRRCGKCNTAMDSYLIDESRKLHVCGNNPDCDGYEVEQGDFEAAFAQGKLIDRLLYLEAPKEGGFPGLSWWYCLCWCIQAYFCINKSDDDAILYYDFNAILPR